MRRTYESGAAKRKKKAEIEENIKKHNQKLDSFLLKTESNSSNIANLTHSCVNVVVELSEDLGDSNEVAQEEEEILKDLPSNKRSDPGLWDNLSAEDIQFWIESGPSTCQNADNDFKSSKMVYQDRDRYCSKNLFVGKKVNGETFNRDWLIYSPASGCVFCFVCKLFETSKSALASTGFKDWKNSVVSIQGHENSSDHRRASLTYFHRKKNNVLKDQLLNEIRKEKNYWREVLKRVTAVICTLIERNLAFRGSNEKFGADSNGNFIGLLELIAKFDPFLAEHIKSYGDNGSGKTNYLSKTTCEEMIDLMAKKVLQAISDDVLKSKYYGLSVDSTPDVSHKDQLCVVLRYIDETSNEPIERFVHYIHIENHTGENLANVTVDFLNKRLNLDISNCRSQSYDNASNMTGKYKGMKTKILELNKLAKFLPCSGHSLNLVGEAAVDCCIVAINFFAIVQELYNFFSASTKLWSVLEKFALSSLKSLSNTRWSAHADSVKSIHQNYDKLMEALLTINENESFETKARAEAGNLLSKMETFEFALQTIMWGQILQRINAVSKSLQNASITLDTCSKLYSSLGDYFFELNKKFDFIEQEAKSVLPGTDYLEKRHRKRKLLSGETRSEDPQLSPREDFKTNVFFKIINNLATNLKERAQCYVELNEKFGFLIETKIVKDKLKICVDRLVKDYAQDIDDNLYAEIEHLHLYIKDHFNTQAPDQLSHLALYKLIKEKQMEASFPNTEIILRIFICFMISNCSAERSFSKLKLTKNDLRSTLSQKSLNNYTLLSCNVDKMKSIDFDSLVKDFVEEKCRKKII